MINLFDENVKKLKEVFKDNDPYANKKTKLNDIITEAVMPDPVKDAVLTRDKVGQDLFTECVKKLIDKTEPADIEDDKINREELDSIRRCRIKGWQGPVCFFFMVLSRPETELNLTQR